MNPQEYVVRIGEQCIVGLLAVQEDLDVLIIGANFMKAYYTDFDFMGRVGFAPAR